MNKFKVRLYKYTCFLLCLFLFWGVIFVPVAAKKAESKTVRVGWFEGTYNTTSPNGEKGGYGYEYQQTVAAYTGWKYEYVTADWCDLLKMLQNGEIDLMCGVSYTKERADTMLFSELPMGEEKYYLYANLSQTDICSSDLTTLNGKRIGMLEKSSATTQYCEWEEKHGIRTNHVVITSAKDVHEKLVNNKIDGFVLNESPQWEAENLSAVTVVGGSDNYFIINSTFPADISK